MSGVTHAPVTDRVRANSWIQVNDRVGDPAQLRLRELAPPASTDEFTDRVTQLDHERISIVRRGRGLAHGPCSAWALGSAADKRSSTAGPLPLFRKMGAHTRREINQEKYALKAVRGDFEHVSPEMPPDQEERR